MSKKITGWLLNKYIISLVLFGVWMTFFDENNLINQFKARYELNKLRAEKQYYADKIKEYEYQIKAIDNDPSFIEQYAREHYYMSRDNEDVFVVINDTTSKSN